MDEHLKPNTSFLRLKNEYEKYGTLVVAYDFDDTVYDFHKKGREYVQIIDLLRKLSSANCYMICWTGNEDLAFVNEYLKTNKIPFNAINENPPFHKSKSRKIYANVYLDDRAGLKQTYQELTLLLTLIENK